MCKKIIILITISLTFFSCKKNVEIENNEKYSWDYIIISNTSEEIKVYKEYDTASFSRPIYKLVEGNEIGGKYELINTERETLNFTEAEKDSIASYVLNIINNPVEKNEFCTDYVGKLNVKIGNWTSSFSANYKSVCKIDTISKTTLKLHKLLNTKIKFNDY